MGWISDILELAIPGITSANVVQVEVALIAAAVLVALMRPHTGAAALDAVERRLHLLAERPRLAVAAVGLFALAVRLALLPVAPVPVPGTHDDFSYLLAADTFMYGRLANPPHPLWPFFETFHTIHHPTYASMYPPLQGASLFIGRLISGQAWTGALLAAAGMCAALTWMLQGWFPAGWALVGGALAVLRIGTFSVLGEQLLRRRAGSPRRRARPRRAA